MRGRARMIALGGLVALSTLAAAAPARASGIVGGYRVVDLGPIDSSPLASSPHIDDAGKIGPFVYRDSGAYSLERVYDPYRSGVTLETRLIKAGSDENLLPKAMSVPSFDYRAVNASGHLIVKRYDLVGGHSHSTDFYYEPETGKLLEPKPFTGADHSPSILALNDHGQMVGVQDNVALFYEDPAAEPIELGRLLGTDSGWRFNGASGINNRGEIVGYGVSPDNRFSTFKLEPVPEPSSLIVFGLLCLASLRIRSTSRRRVLNII